MGNFINFDKMITPTIVKIIFWIGVVLTVIGGIVTMFGGGLQILIGLLTIILGPLVVRIYCELIIVMFKIHESLVDLNRKTLN